MINLFSNQFEEAFDDFINRREFDRAENALFSMVRIAFIAGWLAAGGAAPAEQKIFQLVSRKSEEYRSAEETGETIKSDLIP